MAEGTRVFTCPAHGPHRQLDWVCPGCLKSEYKRMGAPIPLDVKAAVERQQHLKGLRAIGRF